MSSLIDRDEHESNLNRVQLDSNADPNLFIGPKLEPKFIGSKSIGPEPRPLGFSGSRVWIWLLNNLIFFA